LFKIFKGRNWLTDKEITQSLSVYSVFHNIRFAHDRSWREADAQQLPAKTGAMNKEPILLRVAVNSDIQYPVTPLRPGFGLPVMRKTADRDPVDDALAAGETLEAGTFEQWREMIGMHRSQYIEP
jgi:hypothetical protein